MIPCHAKEVAQAAPTVLAASTFKSTPTRGFMRGAWACVAAIAAVVVPLRVCEILEAHQITAVQMTAGHVAKAGG